MIDTVFAIIVVTPFAAALIMAWAIGAVAIGGGAFAPAVGATVIPVQHAACLLGIVGFAGALIQGSSVTETVGRGLVLGTSTTPMAASVAILLSALLMAVGAFGRFPIPAAFTAIDKAPATIGRVIKMPRLMCGQNTELLPKQLTGVRP